MKRNPKGEWLSRWFQPPKYPDGVIVCPLCGLPESEGEYKHECHCWDVERVEGKQ